MSAGGCQQVSPTIFRLKTNALQSRTSLQIHRNDSLQPKWLCGELGFWSNRNDFSLNLISFRLTTSKWYDSHNQTRISRESLTHNPLMFWNRGSIRAAYREPSSYSAILFSTCSPLPSNLIQLIWFLFLITRKEQAIKLKSGIYTEKGMCPENRLISFLFHELRK